MNGFSAAQLNGLSGNNYSVANYLNKLPPESLSPSFNSLVQLTGASLNKALETISPSRNSAINYVSQITLFLLNGMLESRFTSQRRLPEKKVSFFACNDEDLIAGFKEKWITPKKKKKPSLPSYSVWADGFGDFARQSADSENPTFSVKTAGLLVGFDAKYYDLPNSVLDSSLIGVAGSYVHSSLEHRNHFGKNDFDAGYLVLYGTLYSSRYYVDLSCWNGYEHIDNTRFVFFSDFYGRAESGQDCYVGDVHTGSGYDYPFETRNMYGIFEPFIGLDWAYNYEEGYQEKGAAPYNMHVGKRFSSMLQTEVGTNTYFNWEFDKGVLTLREKFSYINRQPFGVGKTNVNIVGSPGSFSVAAFTHNQSLFSPLIEIAWREKSGNYGSLLYDGEFGSGWISNEVVARIGRFF